MNETNIIKKEGEILKILPLHNLSEIELAKAMCGLGYCFLENISRKYYDECGGRFSELTIDIEWLDDPEEYYLFLGVSIAYNIHGKLLPDYYGFWVKKHFAEKEFNLGWVPDYCL